MAIADVGISLRRDPTRPWVPLRLARPTELSTRDRDYGRAPVHAEFRPSGIIGGAHASTMVWPP